MVTAAMIVATESPESTRLRESESMVHDYFDLGSHVRRSIWQPISCSQMTLKRTLLCTWLYHCHFWICFLTSFLIWKNEVSAPITFFWWVSFLKKYQKNPVSKLQPWEHLWGCGATVCEAQKRQLKQPQTPILFWPTNNLAMVVKSWKGLSFEEQMTLCWSKSCWEAYLKNLTADFELSG